MARAICRAILSLGLSLWAGGAAAQSDTQSCRPVVTPVAAANSACFGSRTISIAAAGDVLLHSPLQRKAYAHPLGFRSVWGSAEPFFQAADVAYVNLEGPVASGMTRAFSQVADPGMVFDGRVYTSYPLFNYHKRVVDDLVQSGIDIVSTANNHALDRGARGADLTIDALKARNLAFTGTIRAGDARQFVHEMDTPLGRLAWLACTYSTNGVPDRRDQVLGCFSNRDEVLQIVSSVASRPDIAAVIVTPHWGFEYQSAPNARQRALAADLARAGAVVILGTHPHVVQPWEYLEGRWREKSLVVYSTGNFVSGQSPLKRRTGALFWIELCQAPPASDLGQDLLSRLTVAHTGWVPFYMANTAQGRTLQYAGGDTRGARQSARRHAQSVMAAGTLDLALDCEGAQIRDGLQVALQ